MTMENLNGNELKKKIKRNISRGGITDIAYEEISKEQEAEGLRDEIEENTETWAEEYNPLNKEDGEGNPTTTQEHPHTHKQEAGVVDTTPLEDDGKWLDNQQTVFEDKAADEEKIKEEENKLKEAFEKQKEGGDEDLKEKPLTTEQILESLSDEKIAEKAKQIANEAVEKVMAGRPETQKTRFQEKDAKKFEWEIEKENQLKTTFAEKFNITEKEYSELEKNEDFKNLSHGQKLFILKNLEQVSLDKTLMESQERFDASLAKSGVLGKVWKNIRKEYLLAGHKKDIAKEMASGGLTTHKNTIEQLTNRALMMNVPMIENEEGELEMQFGKIEETMTDKEKAVVRDYNQKATAFAFTPHEWTHEAGGSNKEAAKHMRSANAFYDTQELYALLVKKYNLPEDYSVNRKIKLQQFLTTNPDAEAIMNDLQSTTNQWKRLVGKDLLVERGVYTGLGYAARGVTPLLNIAQAGAPVAAFVLGSIRGGLRANKNLERKTKEARRGKQDTSKTAKNFMDAFSSKEDREKNNTAVKSLGERLEDLVTAYENTTDPEQQKILAQQLYNRSQYTLRKMSDGLINFGREEMRIANQTRLMNTIALAESYAAVNTDAGLATANRLESILDIRSTRIKGRERTHIAKEAVKAGLFGAGFATAGLMGKEIIHGIKEWLTVETPEATTAGELTPRYHTQVATETPNTHIVGKGPVPPDHIVGTIPKPEGIDHGYIAERDDTYVAMPEPNVHIVNAGETLPTPPPAPPYHPSELEIKPIEIKFDNGHGAIATFKELKEKLLEEYKGVPENKIPESVKTILHDSPTKLAEKFGFYNPNDPSGAESALVIKGSSLSIDSAGNLDYHHVGQNTYHVLEFSDGNDAYDYDEKMFDYDHSNTIQHSTVPETRTIGEFNIRTNNEDWFTRGAEQAQNTTPVALSESEVAPDGNIVKRYTTWSGPKNTTAPEYTTRTTDGGTQSGYPTGKGGYTTGRGMTYRPPYNSQNYNHYNQGVPRPIQAPPSGGSTPEQTVATGIHFSGQVNRQYHKLIEELFGQEDIVSRESDYDQTILSMLTKNSALEDIHSEAGSDATEHMRDYFGMVKEIHEKSGLEPKSDTESTGLYIKEALEKIKADGGNVRKFVNQLIKQYK